VSGPSGSGKTTLLSVIGALDTPTSGDLTLFGKDVKNLKDAELSRIRLENIGFIFQEHNLLQLSL
jgi:ABC-type lipoprotein export system ATPase subunit